MKTRDDKRLCIAQSVAVSILYIRLDTNEYNMYQPLYLNATMIHIVFFISDKTASVPTCIRACILFKHTLSPILHPSAANVNLKFMLKHGI